MGAFLRETSQKKVITEDKVSIANFIIFLKKYSLFTKKFAHYYFSISDSI